MSTTIDPVAEAISQITRPAVRCIGHYLAATGSVDLPISWTDSRRDADWVARYLAHAGVAAGQFVVVVSTGHEAPWYGAVLDALMQIKATVCPLEPAAYELGRAQMFFRRFPVSHVLGLDLQVATALEKGGGLHSALSGVKMVAARPDAIGYLRQYSVAAGLMAPLGPALALPCTLPGTVHINEEEWEIEADGAGCLISARQVREYRPHKELLAQRATLEKDACGCPHGRIGIRLAFEGA